MAFRARFPGKPNKAGTLGRVRVSYQDSDESSDESEYSKIASQTATNLKAFRAMFGSSDEDEAELLSFSVDDAMKLNCQEKVNRIVAEIATLKMELLGGFPSNSLPSPGSALPPLNIIRGHFLKSTESMEYGLVGEPGPVFSSNKSRRNVRKFSPKFLSSGKSNDGTNISALNQKPQVLNGNGTLVVTPVLSASRSGNVRIEKANEDLSLQNQGQVTLLPNDNANFRRIKGARIKQLRHDKGFAQRFPLSTFADFTHIPSQTVKGIENMPKLPEGSLRSGKFTLDTDETESEGYSDSDSELEEANGEMLLDRQNGLMRVGPKGMIKGLCPFDSEDVEQNGFPIIVDVENGSFPHKPLCFLCGSAGIEQVWCFIFSVFQFSCTLIKSFPFSHMPNCD